MLRPFSGGKSPEESVCGPRISDTNSALPELLPLTRIVRSLESRRLPLAIVGGSPSLTRVLQESRDEDRVFVAYQPFDSDMLCRCIRQAYQDVFSMVEKTALVEYEILRLKTAVYEVRKEERITLCKRIRQEFEEFADLRGVLSDLVDLWSSIRPYTRCTSSPEAKDNADRVSYGLISLYIFVVGLFVISSLLCFVSSFLLVF